MPNRFYVQPASMDVSGLLSGLGSIGQQQRQAKANQQREQELMEAYKSGDHDKVAEITFKYPESAKGMHALLGQRTDDEELARGAKLREMLADPDGIEGDITQEINNIQAQGGDPSQQMEALRQFQENPEGFRKTMELEYARVAPKQEWEAYKNQRGLGDALKLQVGSQEILEDGTIIQSTNKGPVVYNPLGEQIKGQAAADAIQEARAQKVSNLRQAAGEKKRASLEAEDDLKARVEAGIVSAKAAAKISAKAFDRLEKINLNISNMDEAIQAIDEGASTGVVVSMLPSVQAASQKLDNLQKRLGLDVVGQTTFGALSKGELDLALSSALPTNMQPAELRKWLTTKKQSMDKLSDYVEASAIYLGTPGNTVKGWIEYNRGKQGKAEPAQPTQDMNTQALEWAKSNPDDPRAAQILQKLGVQ